MNYFLVTGVLLTGTRLEKTERFLNSMGLRYEGGADYTAQLVDEYGEIAGNGCLCGNVLKYIGISDALQGEGAATRIVGALVTEAYRRGIKRLFLFTKPSNEMLFRGMGFYTITETADAVFMENSRSGLKNWLSGLDRGDFLLSDRSHLPIGAVVVNCNPFTKGHRYLIETAASEAGLLHIFVVSENRSRFSFKDRYEMVRRGVEGITNIIIHPSGDYIISQATFPTYFLKETADADSIYAALDLTLFGKRIAPALGITNRFVGTEPYCNVTRTYNECMKRILPPLGVKVTEYARIDGISASCVRAALDNNDYDALAKLAPESTLKYIREEMECGDLQ